MPGSALLTPAPRGSDPAEIDTRDGTVHMIIGGGHSAPTPLSDFDMPQDGVLIVGVGPGRASWILRDHEVSWVMSLALSWASPPSGQ